MPDTTRIQLELHTRSPLFIGGEARVNTLADRALLKNLDGVPYIPATTLKGRLRHQLEQLLGETSGPQPDTMHQPTSEPDMQQLGTIERLFGTPWHDSPLFFDNLSLTAPAHLFVENDPSKPLKRLAQRTQTRYGVGINRRRRVAQDKRLYTTELFAPGLPLTFSGTIHANVEQRDLILLIAGLESIDRIGGSRSRGFGHCKISVSAPDIDSATKKPVLIDWLRGNA